jgi:hypothetical protein
LKNTVKVIILNGVEYYNRKTLNLLGLEENEIKDYFNNQIIEWTDPVGNVNKLVRVKDFNDYIRFKSTFKDLFLKISN